MHPMHRRVTVEEQGRSVYPTMGPLLMGPLFP